jgi:hypothetical protein
MKTPIQTLIDYCIKNAFNIEGQDGTKYIAIDYDELKLNFDFLLGMEKQIIIDAWNDGQSDGNSRLNLNSGEEYYNENFKNK